MSEDLTGRTLGAYQIVEMIGMGGMATVYKAVQPNMERDVAIKVLPRALAHDPTFVGRFKQEAKVIARLEHARILPVYDYGEEDGIIYLVMRYLNAGTLSERMEQGAIPLDEMARIITQIAEGLDHAHKRGVFHRDIKPSNILLDESGDAYITDFGIARIAEGTAQFTGSGIVGTPTYISPEQAMGNPVDGRTDVYSLGVVLYQMLTGDVPYQAETPMGVLIKHINDPLPLPRTVKPDIPANIEAVLLRSLAKNPDARYQTAGEMARDLREASANPSAPSPADTATVGGLVGAYASHDTMPMSAPDIASTKQSSPTGVLPPPTPDVTAAPAKPPRPRWMIPLGAFGVFICMCLCVLLMIQAARDSDSEAVEATLDELVGQPTQPPVVAEITDDTQEAAEPAPGDSESADLNLSCPPAFDTLADFDFAEIPAGLQTVGSATVMTTGNGKTVLAMLAEGEDPSYMVFEPATSDVSVTAAFIMPSGAASFGLILRAGGDDTGYSGVILGDGTAYIMRNTEAVASGTLADDVFDGNTHGITLRANGASVTLLVDGEQTATYLDPDPLPAGFIGFGAGDGEVWIDGLLACGIAHGNEPLLTDSFDEALNERWSWLKEPSSESWALADGLLRIDAMPGTGLGSGATPVIAMEVPPVLDTYTVEVTVHIQAEPYHAAGIALFNRTDDVLASVMYGVRPSADGDVEAVYFDDWIAANLDREGYQSQIAGAGFLVDEVVLRLMVERGTISAAYSYDGGATWEPAGSWTMAEARIAYVGLFTAANDDSETIPVYFNDFTVYNGILSSEN